MKLALKAAKYLFTSPRYFFLYFFGKPEKVLNAVTGAQASRFNELSAELERDPLFSEALAKRTLEVLGEDFHLAQDHYFLYALTRLTRPRLVVETGVFDGYFTASFLKGLHDNAVEDGVDGRLISIDLPAYAPIADSTDRYADRTSLPPGCEPGWVLPDDLRSRWELHLGDARQLLPEVCGDLTDLDIFFHDSLHTYDHMTFEYETAWPRLRTGGVLMTHDVHWNAAFRHFTRRRGLQDPVVHGFGITRKP